MPLVYFAYNNSHHLSIFMDPYVALYGRICKSLIGLFEVGESSFLGPCFIYKTLEKFFYYKESL